ncbi:MAG: 4Fe-4S dicluster domain-containing protein [Hyphomicrobiaceae bacterium]
MSPETKAKLLVCNCQQTMDIDGEKLARALGRSSPVFVHSELCRAGLKSFEESVGASGSLHVACTQEAALFREVAEERATSDLSLRFTNIRENAGWSDAKGGSLPKMAALIAQATHSSRPADSLTLTSSGVCLVYGPGEAALAAAEKLADRLDVTVLLTDASDALPPSVVTAPIAKGVIKRATGHLGAFEIIVDGFAPVLPSARSALDFAMPRDGAKSKCDLILDVSGNAPLFTAGDRRDGYIAVPPDDRAAIGDALLTLVDLVGEFEKPVYIAYDPGICAHSRSGKVGCRNCLDHCPVGAITPDGDHVRIDPAICGGCGNCASVCPTGAASYAYPRREDILARSILMLDTYSHAGGKHPVILLHDGKHGRKTIDAMARFGRGLPANVLPLALNSVLQLSHDTLLELVALGAEQIVVLAPPEKPAELAGLEMQSELAGEILTALGYDGPRLRIIAEADPFVAEAILHELAPLRVTAAHRFSLAGTRRDLTRTAMAKLNAAAPTPKKIIALGSGAPYGRITINADGCTLCLACVGACPTGALSDNAERPEVAITESACVQCGVCKVTCPEKVIALEPRYNFTNSALSREVVHGEEPFNCISCGKTFGARAMIERVTERLRSHSMFADEKQLAIIQMCDDCRVNAMANMPGDPFKGGERPRVITTEDYLADKTAANINGKPPRTPDDFLN